MAPLDLSSGGKSEYLPSLARRKGRKSGNITVPSRHGIYHLGRGAGRGLLCLCMIGIIDIIGTIGTINYGMVNIIDIWHEGRHHRRQWSMSVIDLHSVPMLICSPGISSKDSWNFPV